jgi:type IV secretory pathway TrbF-like protein
MIWEWLFDFLPSKLQWIIVGLLLLVLAALIVGYLVYRN